MLDINLHRPPEKTQYGIRLHSRNIAGFKNSDHIGRIAAARKCNENISGARFDL